MFWILSILSFAAAEKLDRTYLPPPGAKFSGGSPGVIRVPLEYPKLEYTKYDLTTKPEIAIGIDRVGPKQILNSYEDIDSNNTPLIYTDKSYTIPTTDYTPTKPPPYNHRNIVLTDFPTNNTYSLQNSDFSDEYPNQNTYTYPETEFVDEKNYPQQFQYGNNVSDMPGVIKQDDVTTSLSFNIDSQPGGDVDSIIANSIIPTSTPPVTPSSSISENKNLPSVINNNQNNYYSTLPTVFSSITKSPINDYNKHYSLFELTTMRPERIQAQADRQAVILNYENVITPEGYAYSFDTSNGIHGDENGITLNGVRAKGSYSYVGDDGKLYTVVYTADENGFRPQGDHLPTAPPIPDEILKVIEKAYQDKKTGVIDDGSYDENKYGYKRYEKMPYGQRKLIKPVKINDDLNSKMDFGINPSHTTNFVETPMKPNGNAYSTIGQVFAVGSPPETNDYELKQLPQSDKKLTKTKQDKDDLGTGDDNLNYIHKSQKLPSTVINPTTNSGFYAQKINYSTTPSNEDTKTKPYTETGYEYFHPTTTESNLFPTRFTEIKSLKTENDIQEQKTTPKPFLTPYVSRNYDETQNYDSDEKINQEPQRINYGANQKNYIKYPNQRGNEKEGNNYNNYKSIKNGNNDGYIYQKYEEPYIQFTNTKPTLVPVVSTAVPKEFPPRLSTNLLRNQYDTGVTQASSRPNSSVPSIESVTENKTSLLTNYSTVQPDFINKYLRTDLPNNFYTYKDTSGKTSGIPEEASVSPIPHLKVSYSPNIDTTVYTDLSKLHSSSDKFIGEDFSGPKRPQSFDPLTGYQY